MHDILSELQIFTEWRCLNNLADICLSILVIQERAGKDKVFENSQLAASSWLYGINRHKVIPFPHESHHFQHVQDPRPEDLAWCLTAFRFGWDIA